MNSHVTLILYSGTDISKLKCTFGMSNEFLKSLGKNIDTCKDIYYDESSLDTLIRESKLLASCLYEENTQWGKQARDLPCHQLR